MRFEELLMKLDRKLRGVIKKTVRPGCYLLEDDLYQEAVLFLWRMYADDACVDKTESFLLQGCYFYLKNLVRTQYKRIDRQRVFPEYSMEEGCDYTVLDRVASEEGATEIRHDNDAKFIIERLARILSTRERQIVDLLAEGLTRREIGYRLGISHVMVLKHEKNIRQKCGCLRDELIQ